MSLVFLVPPSLGRARANARAELLTQSLSTELGEPVEIVVPNSYEDLANLARNGQAHLAWCPSAVCAQVEATSSAIFKAVRGGQSTYRSVIVMRRGETVQLRGMQAACLRAAWVDPLSVGGYLLAVDYLRQHGIEPDRVFVSQNFVGSHPDAVNAVLHGAAELTAVTTTGGDDASVAKALALYVGPASTKLAHIAVTDESPNDGIALLSPLSPDQIAKVTALLSPAARPSHAPPPMPAEPTRDSSRASVRPPSFRESTLATQTAKVRPRRASILLSALECEGFARSRYGEYRTLLRLLHPTRV